MSLIDRRGFATGGGDGDGDGDDPMTGPWHMSGQFQMAWEC